ncbi:MAM domain-containing protein 2-like, partial [Fukomys damarensis]|uniref:MAM domain-containing protein 2-like n=1 Tax=Fukomys damarensis TaxID=885580 RepID=UPI00053F9B46
VVHVSRRCGWILFNSPCSVFFQGYYMYIEASHMVHGQKACLLSRPLRGVPGKHCLTFFYHMYGAGTGLLSVYLKKEEDSEESLLWRRRGEQSISWLRALIQYSCPQPHQLHPLLIITHELRRAFVVGL